MSAETMPQVVMMKGLAGTGLGAVKYVDGLDYISAQGSGRSPVFDVRSAAPHSKGSSECHKDLQSPRSALSAFEILSEGHSEI